MNEIEKVKTRTVVIPDDLEAVKKLWFDYLVWGNDNMQELYGVHPHNPNEAVEQDIQQIGKFQPPYGQLILAIYEGKLCGLGSLKRINSDIGELKRMFVDPASRRIGAGRAILDRLLLEAKKVGYKKFGLTVRSLWKQLIPYTEVLDFVLLTRIQKWKSPQNLKTIYCLWNWI